MDNHPIPFPSSLTPSISDVLEQPMDTSGVTQSTSNSRSTNSESSKQTDSDKLSALPPSLPASPRIRYPPQNNTRRSLDNSPRRESPPQSQPVYRPSASEGSIGKESPRMRSISFDSDHSMGTLRSIRQIASRVTGQSDKHSPSAGVVSLPASNRRGRSNSLSTNTHSRAASPLRLFQWSLHRTHSREEPFIAVDPFKWSFHMCNPRSPGHEDHEASCLEGALPFSVFTQRTKSSPKMGDILSNSRSFLSDTLPRQFYLNFLLRLPALYFSRIARIFEDAEVSKGDMQRIIDASRIRKPQARTTAVPEAGATTTVPWPEEWVPPNVSPALARFKRNWEDFIDSLMREWKTLNLVSALLCSAILTMFQVPEMAYDPITRTAALISLICALMSLSYGCIFIVRFGTMRNMHRACRWAEEAQRSKTSILWNVWVLLATPAVWIAWSMIAFIVSILSYVWRSGSEDDPVGGEWPRLSAGQSLGPRLVVTGVVGLGLVYFGLIVKTFTKYGMGDPAPSVVVGGGGADGERGGGREGVASTDLEKGDVEVEVEAQRQRLPTPKL